MCYLLSIPPVSRPSIASQHSRMLRQVKNCNATGSLCSRLNITISQFPPRPFYVGRSRDSEIETYPGGGWGPKGVVIFAPPASLLPASGQSQASLPEIGVCLAAVSSDSISQKVRRDRMDFISDDTIQYNSHKLIHGQATTRLLACISMIFNLQPLSQRSYSYARQESCCI